MKYSKYVVKEHLESIGFLYDEELVYPSENGCVMNVDDKDYQYMRIKFRDNNNHKVEIKPYSTFKPKVLKHKVGREIWNNQIKKKNNIKKLIDKI
jgi:hypothetical protein